MQSPESHYWVYNLSEFVFQPTKVNFDWVLSLWGIIGLLVFFGGGIFGTWFLAKKYDSKPKAAAIYRTLNSILAIAGIIFLLMFGINKLKFNWGLRWYSTMYVLGFALVYVVCSHWIKVKKMMLTQAMLDSLIAYLFIGMVLGARTFYVFIYNFKSYMQHPLDAFKVWEGGLSFHGGIAGVAVAIILFCRKYKLRFFHLTDKLVLLVPFGIGMGRIGNFLNRGELYGRVIESDVPWAVIFPQAGPMPRHPSQIYQSLCEGWLLLLVLFLISRKKYREGVISACFVFFYGMFRFPMEFFREADEQLKYYFNNTLTMGQILCLLTMLFGLFLGYLSRNNVVEGTPAWQKEVEEYQKNREAEEAKLASN